MNSKYSNFLTVLLVIVIIAIIGIIGFLGYRYIRSTNIKNDSQDFVNNFVGNQNVPTDNTGGTSNDDYILDVDEGEKVTGEDGEATVQKFNGFVVAGTIEIPATGLSCPILDRSEYSKSALETSVCELYGPGLNQPGNTVIAGHNYRNGNFFSNNKKLKNGDKVYITDLTGKRLSYTIYNIYETTENDADYMVRDTGGATEVSLATCTDDSQKRLVIWAKADV